MNIYKYIKTLDLFNFSLFRRFRKDSNQTITVKKNVRLYNQNQKVLKMTKIDKNLRVFEINVINLTLPLFLGWFRGSDSVGED